MYVGYIGDKIKGPFYGPFLYLQNLIMAQAFGAVEGPLLWGVLGFKVFGATLGFRV